MIFQILSFESPSETEQKSVLVGANDTAHTGPVWAINFGPIESELSKNEIVPPLSPTARNDLSFIHVMTRTGESNGVRPGTCLNVRAFHSVNAPPFDPVTRYRPSSRPSGVQTQALIAWRDCPRLVTDRMQHVVAHMCGASSDARGSATSRANSGCGGSE